MCLDRNSSNPNGLVSSFVQMSPAAQIPSGNNQRQNTNQASSMNNLGNTQMFQNLGMLGANSGALNQLQTAMNLPFTTTSPSASSPMGLKHESFIDRSQERNASNAMLLQQRQQAQSQQTLIMPNTSLIGTGQTRLQHTGPYTMVSGNNNNGTSNSNNNFVVNSSQCFVPNFPSSMGYQQQMQTLQQCQSTNGNAMNVQQQPQQQSQPQMFYSVQSSNGVVMVPMMMPPGGMIIGGAPGTTNAVPFPLLGLDRDKVVGNSKASSRYRGVSWHKRDRKWLARTWIGGRIEHLGCYQSEEMAALAVDLRTLEHFGNKVKKELNFPNPLQRQQLVNYFTLTGEFHVKTAEDLATTHKRGPNRKRRLEEAGSEAASKKKHHSAPSTGKISSSEQSDSSVPSSPPAIADMGQIKSEKVDKVNKPAAAAVDDDTFVKESEKALAQ